MHPRLPLAIASLVLGLSACRTPSSRIPIEKFEAADETQTKGEKHERLEPLPVEQAADMLPAEVAVMAEAIEPGAVLALINRLDKYPDFQQVRSDIAGELGVDLLDAGQWQKIGVDRHGPVGFGLLDVESQGLFAYAKLTDEGAFEQFIVNLADRNGARERLGVAEIDGAKLYRLGDEVSVIVREGFAVFVFVDRPDRAARDYAATVATIDPREALSRSEGFVWARAQIEAADDGLVYVAPRELIDQIDRGRDDYDHGVQYAEDELARARANGEPRETIEMLERRVAEEQQWVEERKRRDAARRELVGALFEPMVAVVGAAELREDAISGHLRVLAPGPNLLSRVLLPVEAETPLLGALDEPPLWGVDGRVDVQAMLELVDLMARTDGESLVVLNTQLRAELGVDVLGELIPALGGAGGFILTQQREPDPRKLADLKQSLGVAAYVELAKPEVIRKALDGVAQAKRVPGLSRAKRGDGWLLAVPDWHEVQLDIVGSRLVVSTDAKLAGRIRDAKAGRQAAALADPQHPFRGTIPTPALRLYFSAVAAVILDSHEPWTQEPEAMLWDLDTHHVLSPEQAAEVPRSAAFKRKFKEFEKAVRALDEHQRREAVVELERQLAFARDLGDLGMQVERHTDGFGARGQWRMAPGVTLLDLWMPLMMGGGAGMDYAEYERLSQEINRVREELMVIRRADLDAAAAKHTP